MGVNGGEEQGIGGEPEKASEKAFKHAIKKEAKKKFLGGGGNRDGEDDDNDPLFDRARAIEKLDDALHAGTASEKALRDRIGQGN